MTPRNTILVGDAAATLRSLAAGSVDCVITSPPFYALRDYGVDGQIGLEDNVALWVTHLAAAMHEVARVLTPTGSLWLDLGDSYSRHHHYGAPPKSLLLAPERLLLALTADGWIVRNKVIWAKTNPMPHSVVDRLNTSYDVIYFLVRSRRYYFDLDRIREPHRSTGRHRARRSPTRPAGWAGPLAGLQDGLLRARPDGLPGHPLGKNPGDVWTLPASRYRGAHFATFPAALLERPLLATCPEAVCTACGEAWRRQVSVDRVGQPARRRQMIRRIGDLMPCGCGAPTRPGLVLDPFFGTGTVGQVAARHGRDWLGIELNPAYVALARERLCSAEAPPVDRLAAA